MKPKPKKKKLPTITKLKDKVWKVFSQYIRLRDADNRGECRCISCGKKGVWNSGKIHAGHFMSRRYSSTLFDERNVNSQCAYCNTYLAGNQYKYGLGLKKKYKESTPDELVQLSHEFKKFDRTELHELYDDYKSKVEILKKKLNL